MKTSCFIGMLKSINQEKVDIKPYQYLIEKLIYLLYGTRPNIIFTIGQINKYNLNPKSGHMKTAKKLVKYLKGTIYLELVYESHFQSTKPVAPFFFSLIGYGNSSYVRGPKDKKLVIGYCYFLNRAAIFWYSKK